MNDVPVYMVVNLIIENAEYQALSEHRRAGTRLEFLTMVRGVPPR